MANVDKYGIPPGGTKGPWRVRYWKGIHYSLPWQELMASLALAGWPQDLWGMAGAVCAGESSRNPFVYNTMKRGHFGLFQISRSAWPDFFKTKDGTDMAWVSPIMNARQAYTIYRQQGWGAWEAKTNGSYLAYYPAAYEAAAHLIRMTQQHGGDEKGYWNSLISNKTKNLLLKAVDVTPEDLAQVGVDGLGEAIGDAASGVAQGTVDSGSAVASSVGEMAQVVTGLWTALTTPALWMRLGYGVLGAGLVAGGLFLIVRQQPVVQKTVRAATAVATRGAVS